ncbi:MAG TPA: hypothetical protein VE087_10945 [Xanthobacteraceae bacterium]|nr:hypothetical protein [Xanthobacteraceae bacterium]
MKLFQIEEPDGSPADPDAPGAAIGIDVCGPRAEVAIAVGGNAALLEDRDGFEVDLTVPSLTAAMPEWQALFERARLRAERALARPVTHAVVVADGSLAERLQPAAAAAQLTLLRIATPDTSAGESPALAAAILAEELVPPVAGP